MKPVSARSDWKATAVCLISSDDGVVEHPVVICRIEEL